MTAEQKIKRAVLILSGYDPDEITAKTVNRMWGDVGDDVQDVLQDFRDGEVETDIPSPHSRHYETRSVAAEMPDGSWVGWTYWYGGGKHGNPEEIEWMKDAYDLDVKEEEKIVVVRTFTKRG